MVEVQLQQQSATELLFQVEDCAVKLNPHGIGKAECSCPAVSCCKHILSSILWMQQSECFSMQSDPSTTTEDTSPLSAASATTEDTSSLSAASESASFATTQNTSTPSESAQPKSTATAASLITAEPQAHNQSLAAATLAQVLALSVPKLLKHVNKATRRLAYQLFLNWQQQPEQCQIEITAEKISFQTDLSPHKVQLFAALGLDGMLSDISQKQQSAAHLACIAQLFQLHAPELWQWPEDIVGLETRTTDNALSRDDLSLIAELQQMCRLFIQHGLSHIAKESVLALHILNMQARAQNLPRLGSELRQLHGLMQQFLADDIQITEDQLFDRLAFLYSYLAVLVARKDQPEALQSLRGSTQRDYHQKQQQQFKHIIPMGCEWWQYDSGARGLSLCFWDVTQQQILEVTQARANHLDSTFDKGSAAQSGIWGSNLDYLLQQQLELTQAKSSADDRLSASSDTRFLPKAEFNAFSLEQLDTAAMAISDWRKLDALIQPQSSIQANTQRYVLLRHTQISQPELNELEQCFECRVVDQNGLALKLSLPIEAEYQIRIKNLSSLILHEKPVATLLRIDLSQQRVRLLPCSVWLQKKDGLSIFSLDYHRAPKPPKNNVFQLIAGRIEKMLEQKKQWQSHVQRSSLELLIDQTQSLISFYANIGRAQFDPQDRDTFQQLTQQFHDLGLDLIAANFKTNLEAQMPSHAQLQDQLQIQAQTMAHALLQWRQLLIQLQRLHYKFSVEGQVTPC